MNRSFLLSFAVAGISLMLSNCSNLTPVSVVDSENKIAATAMAFTPQGEVVVAKSTYGTHAGRLYLVAKGSDNSVWCRIQDGVNGTWTSAWSKIGNANQAPGNLELINGTSNGRLYLFTKDSAGKIRYKMQSSGGGWYSTWYTLASGFTAMPAQYDIAAGTYANGDVVVFAAKYGTGNINQIKLSNGTYTDIGGQQLNRRLVVGKNADGRLEIFTTTSGESRCMHKWQTSPNGGWSANWENLFIDTYSNLYDMAVANNQDGRLELFMSSGNYVHHMWQTQASNSQSWGPFVQMSPVAGSGCGLNVGKNADGRLELFFQVNNSSRMCFHAYQIVPNSGWSGHEEFIPGNVLTIMPNTAKIAVGNYDNGRLAVFTIGNQTANGAIHVKYQTGQSSWANWAALTN